MINSHAVGGTKHTFSIGFLLTYSTPGNIGLDEQRPPEATKYPKQYKRDKLHQVPWGVKLNIEQHQAAVSKGVDGTQGEGCNQGSKERTPKGLQREVITHLMDREEGDRKIKDILHRYNQNYISLNVK